MSLLVLQATGQSKVLKSVVRPEGWDDERLKLEVPRCAEHRALRAPSSFLGLIVIALADLAGQNSTKFGSPAHPPHIFLVRRERLDQHRRGLMGWLKVSNPFTVLMNA